MSLEKIFFVKGQNSKKIIETALRTRKKFLANFLNSHDLYQFTKELSFRNSVLSPKSINFVDGFMISVYLSLSNFSVVRRFRGPDFTERFLGGKEALEKKMFFIGLGEKELGEILIKFPNLNKKNLFCYNPPFIKGVEFSSEEINEMAKIINSHKIDLVWVAIASPKQNILSNSLLEKTRAEVFFNVGAAFDFLLGKKKRAPKFWQKFGIEWLYRFITDFRYSRKKVLRSLIALKYLKHARLKTNL